MNSVRKEIRDAALLFAEDSGYKDDAEKSQLVFDFTSGANYMLKKFFDLYLCGEFDFMIELK